MSISSALLRVTPPRTESFAMSRRASTDEARLALLRELDARGYRFVTPTPETHRRVVSRPENARAHDLAGIFGWSLPFAPDLVDRPLLDLMQSAGIIADRGDLQA